MIIIAKRVSVIILLICLVLSISPVHASEKGVGMVLETTGKVTINGKKARLMQPLFPGNVIKTETDGKLGFVSYIDDHEYLIDQQSEIVIEAKSFTSKKGKISVISGNRQIPLPKNTVLISRKISGELFREWPCQEQELKITNPEENIILAYNKVQFRWNGTKDYYKTDLIDKETKKHLLNFPEIKKYKGIPTEFQYDLEYGKSYIFQVREMEDELDDTGKEVQVTFSILPEEEAAKIRDVENEYETMVIERKTDRRKATLLMVDFYNEKKMYYQALDLLNQLKSMDTDNPYVYYYMAEIYENMGNISKSEEMIKEGNKLEEKENDKQSK